MLQTHNLFLERIRELTSPLTPQRVDHATKLQKLKDIQCVALDFYGTMFISGVGDIGIDEQQKQNSFYFTESLEKTGFTVFDEEVGQRGVDLFDQAIEAIIKEARQDDIDYPEPDVRKVWHEVLSQLIEEEYIAGDLNEESVKYFGIEFEFRINQIWPVPELGDVLQSLLSNDVTLGIISNSQYYTPIAFEAFLSSSPKEFGFNSNLLIWSYESGRKKPSWRFYEEFVHAAEKENIAPQEVLYVGNDIRKDIAPAKKLGMKTALYVGDSRSIRHEQSDLKKEHYQADLIIDDLHQILNCLSL